jgi:5'-nucleotidase
MSSENIIIANPEELKLLREKISDAGPEKFHVLADFDRTLIKAFVNGKEVPSMLSVLREEGYLTSDYPEKAKTLFNKYHAIEIDRNTPKEEKKRAMKEWWTKHFELLIKSGLNKKDIERAVNSGNLKFREGAKEFFTVLKELGIPLVIMSSSGLGGDAIQMFLEKENCLYQNICIISNSFEWDEKGSAVGVKEPIIYGMNKDETTLQNFPVFEKIKNRRNVLLMGDSLDDVGMIEGFECDNLIKVGFLNSKVEENLEKYKEIFNVVITNDGDMIFINNLLKELF